MTKEILPWNNLKWYTSYMYQKTLEYSRKIKSVHFTSINSPHKKSNILGAVRGGGQYNPLDLIKSSRITKDSLLKKSKEFKS